METAEKSTVKSGRLLSSVIDGCEHFLIGFRNLVKRWLPQGLYARTLLIFITPMVILQSVVAFVFMERHWNLVTQRLSAYLARDISALIEIYDNYPQFDNYEQLISIANEQLNLSVAILPGESLPAAAPKPFFTLLDRALSLEITQKINRPFWIDTVGRSNHVEVRIKLDTVVMQIIAQREHAYASNSHIFLVWMVGTSLVLIIIAVVFLRNQIRPIQRLAVAAENFGLGREVGEFKPSGAREVRQAAAAFTTMRRRIERQIVQRTAMLAGVSHDLRTILTRFKLQLAMMGGGEEIEELIKDCNEMQEMLEDYLSFAKGDVGEQTVNVNMGLLLTELCDDMRRMGSNISLTISNNLDVYVRAGAMRRCIANLIDNAAKFSGKVEVSGIGEDKKFLVHVDDNGPGISPEDWEVVFRPFHRLDAARNQDDGGTGLGLAIARDIARSHGGDIKLSKSPLGGLRATISVPI